MAYLSWIPTELSPVLEPDASNDIWDVTRESHKDIRCSFPEMLAWRPRPMHPAPFLKPTDSQLIPDFCSNTHPGQTLIV